VSGFEHVVATVFDSSRCQLCLLLCVGQLRIIECDDDDFIGMAANRLDYKQSTL